MIQGVGIARLPAARAGQLDHELQVPARPRRYDRLKFLHPDLPALLGHVRRGEKGEADEEVPRELLDDGFPQFPDTVRQLHRQRQARASQHRRAPEDRELVGRRLLYLEISGPRLVRLLRLRRERVLHDAHVEIERGQVLPHAVMQLARQFPLAARGVQLTPESIEV